MNCDYKKGDRVTVETILGPVGALVLEDSNSIVYVEMDPNPHGSWYAGLHSWPISAVKKEEKTL